MKRKEREKKEFFVLSEKNAGTFIRYKKKKKKKEEIFSTLINFPSLFMSSSGNF